LEFATIRTVAINLFAPSFRTEEVLQEIRICLEKGWTGLGFKTDEFELKWREYTGLPFAHFLTSNTVGLHLALHILKKREGWKDGDEVITTPITFVSTNHAILYEDLKPVFADVDDYLCIDPQSIASRLTSRTRAVMFVGMGGNAGQLKAVADYCRKNKLKLILDAAHMAGTKLDGQHVGSQADVTIFSYQAVKNLPTADAGMICFKSAEEDLNAREMSWLGINKTTFQRFQVKNNSYRWKYDVPEVGFKYHGNSIQAAIAIVQLKYLEADNMRRREICDLYDDLLKDIPQVRRVTIAPGCLSSRHLYQVLVPCRERILEKFYENEIFPGVHYRDNLEYPMYSYAKGTCPNASLKSEELLSLPLHLRLSNGDCQKVADVLKTGIRNLA
jgi:dTDP-4-amino-4,6-dideoxygalactose transaminase